MKKYSIDYLDVVKVGIGNNIRYLICKLDKIRRVYIDVLTGEKINRSDNLCVEPLKNYYYLENLTENQKKVTKSELLKKYREINSEFNLIHNEREENNSNYINYNDILEKATVNFFPKDGCWYAHCFRRPTELNKSNLPCHLRNNAWLAQMLKKDQELNYISDNKILNYVMSSAFFKEKRHEYELEIVKWQINWIARHGEGWIVDPKLGGDLVYMSPEVDIAVRKGVVDTLTKIGMDWEVIQEGLEKYADLWRERFMVSAFRNQYYPVFYLGKEQVNPPEEEHKEKWLKMRRYEYYKKYTRLVDSYGVVSDDMRMTDEEVLELKKYLNEKHLERMQHIEDVRSINRNPVKTLKK